MLTGAGTILELFPSREAPRIEFKKYENSIENLLMSDSAWETIYKDFERIAEDIKKVIERESKTLPKVKI
jgi:hypothetical protein